MTQTPRTAALALLAAALLAATTAGHAHAASIAADASDPASYAADALPDSAAEASAAHEPTATAHAPAPATASTNARRQSDPSAKTDPPATSPSAPDQATTSAEVSDEFAVSAAAVPAAAPALPAAAPPNANAASAPATAPASPPADAESLARTYRRTGAAPTVEITDQGRGAVSLVPFGHGKPILRCAPLRACAVELEPGELILSTSLGDGERWLVQSAAAGPGARTPLLVVKPTACDLSTNLVVATDRRIYELALDSPPCHNADLGAGGGGGAAGAGAEGAYNPRLPYTGLVRFYYPDDLVRRWSDQEALAREQDAAQAAGRSPLAPAARLAHLNFDYSWDRSRRWPWVPAQVFDDGEHTYLVLPPAARLAELPILLAVEPGGALALLTYHLEGQTLVADRVLDRAVLLVGHGRPKDEQRLEIVNRRTAEAGH